MSAIPSTMRAITIPKHGGLEVIQESILPTPQPSANNVLIKVDYAGVNFRDTYVRTGLYPSSTFPVILGQEAAGTVVALPTDQKLLESEAFKRKGLSIGSRVATVATQTFAEYSSSPWLGVFKIPDSILNTIGVAAMVQGFTALTFMTEAYNVQKDDWILVHTAAGGLGLIFCQIGKSRGAHIIGTTSSPEKAELAKAHGAEHVILYNQEDTAARVLEITGGLGVHAVFDGVGKDTWEANFKLIRRKGTIVSVGNASGAVPPFPPLKLIEKNLKVLRPAVPGYMTTPEECEYYATELWKLIESGTVKIKIFKEYPFTVEGVRTSQTDITGRGTSGKLLLKVAGGSGAVAHY
ncbi:NAD(P)-binding protein [Sistotremastrum suecicum HHB10207 ss-3]|uniref:Probable quinone oxidoreductase n=1 Tax=Sistotremastrum suecicum HHB10207 ss-3 TaxID=1314776 RepID=A0A166IMF4_9AGAM|nr:NAD(P)-binding protein [Sistotremastrum suecicum HHB10207 ss-3]